MRRDRFWLLIAGSWLGLLACGAGFWQWAARSQGVPGAALTDAGLLVTVRANQGWQSTGVSVRAGDGVEIRYVSGQWTQFQSRVPPFAADGPTGADTYVCTDSLPADACVEPMPAVPQGALIGRLGDHLLPVGAALTFTATVDGPVDLRINDADLRDNAGSLLVRVRVRR